MSSARNRFLLPELCVETAKKEITASLSRTFFPNTLNRIYKYSNAKHAECWHCISNDPIYATFKASPKPCDKARVNRDSEVG